MKITDIRAMRLNRPARPPVSSGRRPSWWTTDEVANPMSRYPKVKAHRGLWLPKWEEVWCRVTLEDGTWGLVASGVRAWFARSPRRLELVGGLGGLTMIGLGMTLALTGRRD